MIKTFLKKRTIIVLTIFCCFCFLGAFLSFTVKADSSVVLEGGEIEMQYEAGEKFIPPEATIKQDGKSIETKTILHFPDGKAYSNAEYTLGVAGTYTLEYKGVVEGKSKSFYKEFSVIDTPASVWTMDGRGKISYSNTKYDQDTYGALMNLVAGDTITYKQVIDLSNFNKDKSLLTFAFPVNSVGSKEVKSFEIMLTDIYDSANLLRITYKFSKYTDQLAYVTAQAPNQVPTGIEWRGGSVHKNNGWGYPTYVPFNGVLDTSLAGVEENLIAHAAQFFYDNEEKAVYIRGAEGRVNLKEVVMDFDEEEYTSVPWGGFTTGEVYLSVKMVDTQTSTANMFIKDVAGINLQEKYLHDVVAPKITVNTQGYILSDLPKAKVGMKYNLFSCEAFDAVNGYLPVDVGVYFQYDTENQVKINSSKTSFIPQWAGEYTIVYTASDYSGNIGKRILKVNALKELEDIEVSIISPQTQGFAGKIVSIAELHIFGGSSDIYDTSVSVFDDNNNPVEVYANGFTPKKEGRFKVVYEIVDYIDTVQYAEYFVDVMYASHPIFLEEPIFPKVVYKGFSFTFPQVEVFDYKLNEYVQPIISIDEGSGFKDIGGFTYTPTVSGEIRVRYTVANADGTDFVEDTVYVAAIKNGKGYNREAYFVGKNVEVNADENKIRVTTEQDGAGFLYAMPLIADGLDIRFSIPEGYDGFKAVKLTLTDELNSNIVVSFTIGRSGQSAYLSINEGAKTVVLGKFGDSNQGFQLYFNNVKREIFAPDQTLLVLYTIKGEEFVGFTSNKVWVNMEFIGVEQISGVDITRLSFLMNNVSVDKSAPTIFIEKLSSLGGNKPLNSTLVVPKAIAVDAYSPTTTITVTVKDMQGNILSSTDNVYLENVGCDREYEVVLDFYGTVVFEYLAFDGTRAGTQPIYTYIYNAEGPEITLQSSWNGTAKVGTVKLTDFNVLDNESTDIKKSVIIKGADDAFYAATYDGKVWTFEASVSGEYVVMYYAEDEQGNATIVRYILDVK